MKNAYDFGEILRKLRTEKQMTQAQLAAKINKESSIISRYEKNLQSPTFETVREFAAIFNVSMDVLAGMEKPRMISVQGLTENQTMLLKELAEAFHTKNSSLSQRITDKQYLLIGQLVTELTK